MSSESLIAGCGSESEGALLPWEAGVVGHGDEAPLTSITSLGEQMRLGVRRACVLLVGVPPKVLRALLVRWGRKVSRKFGMAFQVAGALLGTTARAARDAWKSEGGCTEIAAGSAVDPACSARSPAAGSPAASDREIPLTNCVRMAIASAAEGRSFQAFERDLARFRLLPGCDFGLQVGGRVWVAQVSAIATMVLQELDAADFNEPLPGLGIPSDLSVVADAVAIGDSVMPRHGEVLVICLSIVSARDGAVHTPTHSAPDLPIGGHSGDRLAGELITALEKHPAQWSLHVLRRRLACIGGDGALVKGGLDARHSSSGAAEQAWCMLHPTAGSAARHAGSAAPPTCTMWDPFHRVDIAAWRAIRGSPQILEVFDMAKEMENLFGMTEGTHILRAVAAYDSLPAPRVVRAPGGTRKAVYLTGVPGSLLDNYGLLVKGLWARVGWKQAGHSKQTLTRLLDTGRRLARANFIFRVLLLHDVLRFILRPFAKQAQGHLEPCTLASVQSSVLEQLQAAGRALGRLQRVLAVVALCRQHATPHELSRFILAFGTGQLFKFFPKFFSHVDNIFSEEREFQGVRIDVLDDHDRSQKMFLGPHCQCAAYCDYLGQFEKQGMRVPQIGPTRLVQLTKHKFKMERDGNGKEKALMVPVWVAAGSPAVRPHKEGALEALEPRCMFRETGLALPAGVQGLGMFRLRMPRCKVSRQMFLIDQEARLALQAIREFLETLTSELTNILTTVGIRDDMAVLMAGAARCWDWPRLVLERPNAADVQAFRSVASLLDPLLRNTYFPLSPAFAAVEQRWPSPEELSVQYMSLCHRVRAAFAAAMADDGHHAPPPVRGRHRVPPEVVAYFKGSFACRSAEVEELLYSPVVHLSLGRLWLRSWGVVCAARVSHRVFRFLQTGLGWNDRRIYRVSLAELRPVLYKRRLGKHPESERFFLPGTVSKWRGKLVETIRPLRLVLPAVVASALDKFPWICSTPDASGRVSWGAARVHHRCRLLAPPDAACESVGSMMRAQWDGRRNICAGQVGDAVALAQAGVKCVGAARDETIISTTVKTLRATSSHQPRKWTVDSQQVQELRRRPEEAGRSSGSALGVPQALMGVHTVHERRKVLAKRARGSVSTELPTAMAKLIQSSRDGSGRTRPLPLTVKHLRATQRGAVGNSTDRMHKKAFLEAAWEAERKSKNALEAAWAIDRANLLQADDPADVSDGDDDVAGDAS